MKKIKFLFYVMLAINVFVACSNGNDSQSVGGGTSAFDKRIAIGCGYNYFGEYANKNSVEEPILDYEMMKANGMIDSLPGGGGSNILIDTGRTLYQVHQGIHKSWGIGATANEGTMKLNGTKTEVDKIGNVLEKALKGIFGFSSSVSKWYSDTTSYTQVTRYAYASQVTKKLNIKLKKIYLDSYLLKSFLTPAARAAINGTDSRYAGVEGIDNLLNHYGTHVIVNAYFGGRVELALSSNNYTYYEAHSMKKTIDASAGILGIGAHGSSSSSSSNDFQESVSECKVYANVYGGSSEYAQSVTQGNYDKWAAGLSDAKNWDLCAFSEDADNPSLIPIVYLCDDPVRAQQIADYIKTTWAAKFPTPAPQYTKGMVIDISKTDFNDSWVNKVECNGKVVAEICKEYIPQISTSKQYICVYPVTDGVPDVTKGYIVDDGGAISWDTDGACTYTLANLGYKSKLVLFENGVITGYNTDITDVTATTISAQYISDVRRRNGTNVITKDYPLVKVANLFVCRGKLEAAIYLDGSELLGLIKSNNRYPKSVFWGVNHQIAPTAGHIATEKDWQIIKRHILLNASDAKFCNHTSFAGLYHFWNTWNDRYAVGNSTNNNYNGCIEMGRSQTMDIVPFDSSNDAHYIRIVRNY